MDYHIFSCLNSFIGAYPIFRHSHIIYPCMIIIIYVCIYIYPILPKYIFAGYVRSTRHRRKFSEMQCHLWNLNLFNNPSTQQVWIQCVTTVVQNLVYPKRDITFLIEVDDTGGHFLSSDKMDSYGVLCVLHRKFPGWWWTIQYSQVLSLLPHHCR